MTVEKSLEKSPDVFRNSGRYSISLCAWAWNEEELIEEFLAKTDRDLRAACDDYEIIVVDDGSTDRTLELLRSLEKQYPSLRVVVHDRNKDCGYCYQTTMPLATKEIICWNTVDMFFDTAEIPKFLCHLDRYDLIQGVRSDLAANPFSRKLTTLVNYYLIRFLFRLPMNEFQNVKFVKKKFMDQIRMRSISSFANPEIAIKAHYLGARIKEVEMTFQKRTKGKAKGARPGALLRTSFDILRFWFLWKVLGQISKGKLEPIDVLPARHW